MSVEGHQSSSKVFDAFTAYCMKIRVGDKSRISIGFDPWSCYAAFCGLLAVIFDIINSKLAFVFYLSDKEINLKKYRDITKTEIMRTEV